MFRSATAADDDESEMTLPGSFFLSFLSFLLLFPSV
jgi:hypothetical protein